jgi:hypothetical protein
MTPYNFRNPPPWADEYIKRKTKRTEKSDIAFVASWGMAHYFYGMSENISGVFLIMIRDPVYACNSLKALRISRHSRNIDELALLYNMTFLSLLWQSSIMVNKPRWMDFDKYVSGLYTPALFRLFDIEGSATNLFIAREHLNEKVNSSGEYVTEWTDYFKIGKMLAENLKATSRELN